VLLKIMVKYINEITREFGIEHHTLRNWEEKGYLGIVERDFTHGRMYDEEQIKRIECIQKVVQKQQAKGMKRTDFKDVERVLFEEFGGMVETRPQSIPATPEVFTNMILKLEKQDKQIEALQQMVMELTKATKELPNAVDHTSEIQEIKERTEGIMTKEQGEQLLSRLAEERKDKEEMGKEIRLLKDKLDIAVDYIQKQEDQPKKNIWQRIFS
jgi:DNA-binding transcriptional MerR regulator